MNRLAQSHSPYLLQHKDNPVDWQPWDDTALAAAKEQGKPIFLSVGYAACHWCHVMEHESFEDSGIAALLNANFVCIKVDREERPDIDKVYMNAVQVMTGHGGWPMSVFLTPDLWPFYAGTYWPHPGRGGMAGFAQVLDAIIHAWNERRSDVLEHASEITAALQELASGPSGSTEGTIPSVDAVDVACERLIRIADTRLGGFGSAPKFPHVADLDLLLRRHHSDRDPRKLRVITRTLDAMANGGIYDHIGGGFARYSVDAHWLVPHFEKMLYDNALLAKLYVDAFQATGNERYATVARETLDYLLRERQDESGGFHSSEDADSEGVEGKYYVWTPDEVVAALGDERGHQFCELYDITAQGNFEGKSIPRLIRTVDEFAQQRGLDLQLLKSQLNADLATLRAVRDQRVHPGGDDKVLMGWNGLAIEAFAVAGAVLQEPRFIDAAERTADFIWTRMSRGDGRFHHAFRRGHAHLDAFQDDLADFANAAIAVFRATGRTRWVERAASVAMQLIKHFEDRDSGGFFYTADDSEQVIARQKDWHDGSVRSGNSAAAMVLVDLAALTGDPGFAAASERTFVAGSAVIKDQSAAAAHLLAALDRFHRADQQTVIAAADWNAAQDLRSAYFRQYRPHTVLSWAIGPAASAAWQVGLNTAKEPIGGRPTVYICQGFHCETPLTGDAALQALQATAG